MAIKLSTWFMFFILLFLWFGERYERVFQSMRWNAVGKILLFIRFNGMISGLSLWVMILFSAPCLRKMMSTGVGSRTLVTETEMDAPQYRLMIVFGSNKIKKYTL